MKKTILYSILCVIVFALVSCSGAITEFDGTWKKPGYSGKKFNNILIVALSNDIVKRSNVEINIARELKALNVNATPSNSVLDLAHIEKDANGKVDTTKLDAVKKSLTAAGYDGAIVVSLLDIKEKTEYVPGQSYYTPSYYNNYGYGSFYYNGFYNYAFTTYDVINTPGYYKETKNFQIESRLFDLTTNEMVWAATSETKNPSNLKDFSSSLGSGLASTIVSSKAVK